MAKQAEKKTFQQYLRENLSWWQYEHLKDLMEETPHMATKVVLDPTKGKLKHLSVLVRLLRERNPSVSAEFIVREFDFGKSKYLPEELEFAVSGTTLKA